MTDRAKSDYQMGDSAENRAKAEELLEAARDAQKAYWDALYDLEECLTEIAGDDVEVEGIDDLDGATVDSLLGEL